MLVFLCNPLSRVLTYSGTVYEFAVYDLPEQQVPFDRLVQVLVLYLFEDFLHVVLNIGDELKLPVVPSLEVLEVQDEWDCPF